MVFLLYVLAGIGAIALLAISITIAYICVEPILLKLKGYTAEEDKTTEYSKKYSEPEKIMSFDKAWRTEKYKYKYAYIRKQRYLHKQVKEYKILDI